MNNPRQPAISVPATQEAANKGTALPWMAFVAGIISMPACVISINLTDPGHSEAIKKAAGFGMMVCVVVFCLGILGACMAWLKGRVRKILRSHPWEVWQIAYETNGRFEWVVLLDSNGVPVSKLIVSSWAHQLGTVVNGSTTTAWFAGDPLKRGVVSSIGGGQPRYAYADGGRQPRQASE